ncbi:hypothetical protein [Paracoccus sphaerophysae]|uniref:Uncharacterized protein n=1 Tax=Paracoccus sphaerophysae TaxID=690417 RepID=A0A099EXE0_9RHOB|nr:hypothetical protein [Paracoccus sphaerophysae]KGJ02597.1 hypothetical protein IC63_14425 [Paracoccus sphaerophysae]
MADPFPPDEARERRVGAWVSGVVHAALIGAVALGGALFRAPQAPAIRMAPVETMSSVEFEAMAAASRGAGPVGDQASAVPAQPRPPSDEVVAGGPVALSPLAPDADPTALPAPDVAGEAAPNLSDLQVPQMPVAVATVAPAPQQPSAVADEAPVERQIAGIAQPRPPAAAPALTRGRAAPRAARRPPCRAPGRAFRVRGAADPPPTETAPAGDAGPVAPPPEDGLASPPGRLGMTLRHLAESRINSA